jgi:hypothetical protein
VDPTTCPTKNGPIAVSSFYLTPGQLSPQRQEDTVDKHSQLACYRVHLHTFRMKPLVTFLCAIGGFAGALPSTAQAQIIHCQLRRESDTLFLGSCRDSGKPPQPLSLRPPANNASLWHGSATGQRGPVIVMVGGDMQTYRTNNGWYPISRLEASDNGLAFTYDASKAVTADDGDVRVLQRALALLPDSARWTRVDDGEVPLVKCPPNPAKRSLFCALRDAGVELDGEFFWGRRAAHLVRESIRARGKPYQHWLTGFNADPATSFQDVRAVFMAALQAAEAEARGRK